MGPWLRMGNPQWQDDSIQIQHPQFSYGQRFIFHTMSRSFSHHFPIIILSFSIIVHLFSSVFHHFPVIFLSFSIIFPSCSYHFPSSSYDFPMIFHLFSWSKAPIPTGPTRARRSQGLSLRQVSAGEGDHLDHLALVTNEPEVRSWMEWSHENLIP